MSGGNIVSMRGSDRGSSKKSSGGGLTLLLMC